jgi:hypothetical protein
LKPNAEKEGNLSKLKELEDELCYRFYQEKVQNLALLLTIYIKKFASL